MLLSRVTIKNYRSVKNLTIAFEPKCRILVGINESGKTNILDALNLIDPKVIPTQRDVREPGIREDRIKEAYVRFIFKFNPKEIQDLTTKLKRKILSNSYESPIIRIGETAYTVDRFCETREGLHVINLLDKTKYFSMWHLGEAQIGKEWKKVGAACPSDFKVTSSKSEPVALKDFVLVDTSQFSIPSEYLEDATPGDLATAVTEIAEAKIEADLLKVLFWNYDEKNLLPPRVNLDQFCANPDTCLPLKRMFQLYQLPDIKAAVTSAREAGANGLNNLLRRVAERTSNHFHDTWREYEGIKFSLTMNGPDLEAAIEDESNHYELSQRSDGFKRFVTFLLMVSAEQESNLLRDTLLLIDEPEIGLHPTGARYLMDELIDISRNNYVVFSTHSIFMVDSKIIKRHLIVRKKNEITEAQEVSQSNIQDEEVIYRALGYSIFSSLKEKNLIFEGWRDKKLFETALSSVPAKYAATTGLESLGRCFVQGVKQVECTTPLFAAGNRKCLILSDGDTVAREHQKRHIEGNGYGVWKRYDEILNGTGAITGEDFVQAAAFEPAIREVAAKHQIPGLPIAELNNNAAGRISILRRWLAGAGIARVEADEAVEAIKGSVFEALKNSDITTEYYDYLAGILPIVETL